MSKLPDFYKILEIDSNADPETIKKAYKKMALKYHPDRNRGGKEKDSEEIFKLVSEAYVVLSDPEKRREYDAAMRAPNDGGNGPAGMGGFDMRFHRHPMNPNDFFTMFNQFFGKPFVHQSPFSSFVQPPVDPFFDNFFNSQTRSPFSTQQHQNVRNARNAYNVHVDDEDDVENLPGSSNFNGVNGHHTKVHHKLSLFLSFKETVYGTERQIHFPIKVECGYCLGTGSSTKQREFSTCQRCSGLGRVSNFLMAHTCDVCSGQGVLLKNACNFCNGDGLLSRQYEDSILIPAGIANGSTQSALFKVKRAKSTGYDEHEVHIKFSVEQHPFFQREGNNVIISVPLSTTQALFGCNIDIPTIYGKNIQITVPCYESQSKYGIVVHRHGFKDPDGQKVGDMICNFKPEFPSLSNLTPREKELYKEIAQIEQTKLTKNQSQYYDFMIKWNGEQNQNPSKI